MYKLIINFKTYDEASNLKALKIAKACKDLEAEAKKRKVEIILSPISTDIKDLVSFKSNVYAQHLDNCVYGSNTGFLPAILGKDLGVKGTLINHSEHRLPSKEIKEKIKILKELGLKSCLCVENIREIKKYNKYSPDFIAIEPKKLIGGDISISTAKPALITNSVKAAGETPILVGAGVKNMDDVRIAVELGAKGILVASGITKAKDYKLAILDLLNGF